MPFGNLSFMHSKPDRDFYDYATPIARAGGRPHIKGDQGKGPALSEAVLPVHRRFQWLLLKWHPAYSRVVCRREDAASIRTCSVRRQCYRASLAQLYVFLDGSGF